MWLHSRMYFMLLNARIERIHKYFLKHQVNQILPWHTKKFHSFSAKYSLTFFLTFFSALFSASFFFSGRLIASPLQSSFYLHNIAENTHIAIIFMPHTWMILALIISQRKAFLVPTFRHFFVLLILLHRLLFSFSIEDDDVDTGCV